MSAPERFAEVLELGHHFPRTSSLEALHQLAYRYMRRNRHKDVHMILGYMAPNDLYIPYTTNLTDKLSNSSRCLTRQYRLTIFCYPNQVVFDIVCRMARLTVMLHVRIILKSSPEGEGFSPIPRMGR